MNRNKIFGLLLAAACFAGGLGKTMAQETLKVEYTLKGIDGVRHEYTHDGSEELSLQIPKIASIKMVGESQSLRVLRIGARDGSTTLTNVSIASSLSGLERLHIYGEGIKAITIPNGMVSLWDLVLNKTAITRLTIPDDCGAQNKGIEHRKFLIRTHSRVKTLSVGLYITEFKWHRYTGYDFEFPTSEEMVRNMQPDNDGVFRVYSRPTTIAGEMVAVDDDGTYWIESKIPATLEIRGAPKTNSLTMEVKADGLELTWIAGTLQHALLVTGPWVDVPTGDDRRHFIRSPHPYGFFRIKP